MWKVLESEHTSVKEAMKRDLSLLRALKEEKTPILHFYEFQRPSFTHGMFLQPSQVLNMEAAKENFDFHPRPTGGGILFHLWDFTFSVLLPKSHPKFTQDTMKNYKTIHDAVLLSIREFLPKCTPLNLLPEDPIPMCEACQSFCFAKPTKFDIMYGGKKIAGAAQRRSMDGFLHQGSISLAMPSFSFLEKFMSKDTRVIEAMKKHTTALLPLDHTKEDLTCGKEDLKGHLLKSFESL